MDLINSIVQSTLIFSTPIIIAALGALYSERSGVVNIAIEGLMMIGAFTSAASLYFLEKMVGLDSPLMSLVPWIAILLGLLAGMLVSILHAYLSVNLNSDQIISGTAINIFAGGITIYLAEILFDQQRTEAFKGGFIKSAVPILKDIPIIGDMLFNRIYYTVYVAFILVAISWYILYKTSFGLRLRGTGENPHALDSLGINIYKMRYIGVLTSGALAGLAGGIMVLTQNTQYTVTSIHGTGFIAMAALIFGQWRPLGLLLASLFFGFAQILSLYSSSIADMWHLEFLNKLPSEFFFALPYVMTVIALVLFSSKAVGPKASGQPFEKGQR